MPVSFEQHRITTGKFQPVLMNILLRKAIAARMKVSLRTKRMTRGVIGLLSVLAVFILLLRCNDVERNPGPFDDDAKYQELSRQLQSAMQIMTEVRQQNIAMERQLTLSHYAIAQDMSFIKQRVS